MISNAEVWTKSDGVEPWRHVSIIPVLSKLRTYGCVVQDRSDISIFHLIERVERLDAIVEQLMEHETDTCTTRKFIHAQVIDVAVDRASEVGREFGDNVEDNVGSRCVAVRPAKRHELCVVFGQLLRNTLLDLGQRGSDVVHKDLL